MKLSFQGDRVLAVVAHPDDAELLCAGTLARAKADGAAVGVAVLCRGDKGQPAEPIPRLAAVRRREMAAAAKLLEAELFWGRVPDGTLADDRRTRLLVVEIYRRFRPSLVLAHAPEDYHPDHRAAAALAEAASWFCASRGHRSKSPALDAPPALWWMDTLGTSGFEPGFYVDVAETMTLKEEMLACHRSQAARGADGDFSSLAELLRRQAGMRGAQAGVAAAEAFRAHHAFKRARAW
jgi:LmbE family N-acetylglucosaminyl deacetylase